METLITIQAVVAVVTAAWVAYEIRKNDKRGPLAPVKVRFS